MVGDSVAQVINVTGENTEDLPTFDAVLQADCISCKVKVGESVKILKY